MDGWTIEFLAPSAAPLHQGGSGLWELGEALAARGHHVRLLYPSAPDDGTPPRPNGVTPVPVPLIGSPRGPFGRAEAFGRNASALLSPAADLVVGADSGAGALESRRTPSSGRPAFAMWLNGVALEAFDAIRSKAPPAGVRGRVSNYLDRRTLRRLESRALARARMVIVEALPIRETLGRYYDLGVERIRHLPLGVPDPLPVGSREEARLALHVPPDVPVAAFAAHDREREGLDSTLAAFRRVRVLFPGARLLVAGVPVDTEPGVMGISEPGETGIARAFRAADVFLYPAPRESSPHVPLGAMRYGMPAIVGRRAAPDGIPSPGAIRLVETDEAGDFASELAELFADPTLRRAVGDAGRRLADELSFGRMAERFEEAVRPIVTN